MDFLETFGIFWKMAGKFEFGIEIKPLMHLLEISIFFTKSCHCQTYQNYSQPPHRLQNSAFQSHFSASKIIGGITFTNEIFRKLWFLKYFVFQKCAQFLLALLIILIGLTMTLSSGKMLFSHRCICDLMPNLIKKSWIVSTRYVSCFIQRQSQTIFGLRNGVTSLLK